MHSCIHVTCLQKPLGGARAVRVFQPVLAAAREAERVAAGAQLLLADAACTKKKNMHIYSAWSININMDSLGKLGDPLPAGIVLCSFGICF